MKRKRKGRFLWCFVLAPLIPLVAVVVRLRQPQMQPGLESPQSTFHRLMAALRKRDMSEVDRVTTISGKLALATLEGQGIPNTLLYDRLKVSKAFKINHADSWALWQKWAQITDEKKVKWRKETDPFYLGSNTACMFMRPLDQSIDLVFVKTPQGWKLDYVLKSLVR